MGSKIDRKTTTMKKTKTEKSLDFKGKQQSHKSGFKINVTFLVVKLCAQSIRRDYRLLKTD